MMVERADLLVLGSSQPQEAGSAEAVRRKGLEAVEGGAARQMTMMAMQMDESAESAEGAEGAERSVIGGRREGGKRRELRDWLRMDGGFHTYP